MPAWCRRSALAWWALSSTGFLLITAYYILAHAVEPLSRDQWQMYDALFTHGVRDTSLSTVSGHRHILAFWLYHLDMHAFHGSNRFLLAVDWLLNLTLISVLCISAWQLPRSTLARTLLCGWITVMLCWLLNIALIGWGFNGINNFMSIVPSVLAITGLWAAVHQHRTAWLPVACVLGVLATLSFANGVLVWIIAFICLYLWRAPRRMFVVISMAATVAIALYVFLPGASAAQATLKWPGSAFVTFPIQVMGGPFYHVLRSWHIGNDATLTVLASGFGCLVTACALWQFIHLLRHRPPVSWFASLCVTAMCIGAGSCLMLSMSRLDDYLDFTVDRFQIFALLVWIGTVGLCFCRAQPTVVRRWEMAFVLFPLLAMPAQLDWGARLAEYRNRVEIALLAYQVYLPVQADAERALHWNWENKLPAFFNVLENIRHTRSNIFHNGLATSLGKPIITHSNLPLCNTALTRTQTIHASDLLDVTAWPAAHDYVVQTTGDAAAGQRWFFQSPSSLAWDGGVLLDTQHTVRGLILPIHNSALPRANGLVHDEFNAYGINRQDPAHSPIRSLVLLHEHVPVCAQTLDY